MVLHRIESKISTKNQELENVPTMSQTWYNWTSKLDLNFWWGKAIKAWHGGNAGKKQGLQFMKNPFCSSMNYLDPNAIDTSRLFTKEREGHIQQERCFICNEQGHVAWACSKHTESLKQGPSKPKSKRNEEDYKCHWYTHIFEVNL